MSLKGNVLKPATENGSPDFSTFKLLKKWNLDKLIAQRQAMADARDKAEDARKSLDSEIVALLIKSGADSVQVGRFKIKAAHGNNIRISEKLLLIKGVTADIIQACKESTPYVYLSVSDPDKRKGHDA